MALPNVVVGYAKPDVMTDGEPCYLVMGDPFTEASGVFAYAETRERAVSDFFRAVDAVRKVVGTEQPDELTATWVVHGPPPETRTFA